MNKMCSAKQTKRNGYTIQASEAIMDGEFERFPPGHLTFPSFEDFQKISNIEEMMYKLNNKKGIKKR